LKLNPDILELKQCLFGSIPEALDPQRRQPTVTGLGAAPRPSSRSRCLRASAPGRAAFGVGGWCRGQHARIVRTRDVEKLIVAGLVFPPKAGNKPASLMTRQFRVPMMPTKKISQGDNGWVFRDARY
jgi:hypothetical protein